MTENDSWGTIHDGNRQVMLKWSAAKHAFVLSPQSSALSTYFP